MRPMERRYLGYRMHRYCSAQTHPLFSTCEEARHSSVLRSACNFSNTRPLTCFPYSDDSNIVIPLLDIDTEVELDSLEVQSLEGPYSPKVD